MPIIRRRLKASDVYPDDIRYDENTDTVQSFIDGEWVDNPEADPRTQTTFPPRDTANPRCDGAQSVADALANQIAQIATAIDNAQTVATIAGLVLGLFSFGVFAIFINIALFLANLMLDAGTAAIEAALPPSAYDDLKCILYCHMDANGRLYKDELDNVTAEVTDQIGGLGATILNGMLNLAGEGGINNLASLGTSTGDCDECPCGCEGGCTTATTTYQYNDAAWTIHGAFTRYSAGTPVGQFDSFTLAGTTAILDLSEEKCITQVSIVINNGCGPTLGADVELFIGLESQGVKNVADRVECGTASATWVIIGGVLSDQIGMIQVGAACAGGYNNLLICARVTTCVEE